MTKRDELAPPSDDLIRFAITEEYGERCLTFDPDCYTCQAWLQYDRLSAQQREPVVRVEGLKWCLPTGGAGDAAIEIQSSDVEACRDCSEASRRDSSEPKSSTSEAIADVSVDELARLMAGAIGICVDDGKSGVWIHCHPAARALLARYRIERLDRLASSGRR